MLAARRAAESASRAAIEGLGVFADRRPEHLDANQAALRNGLRAKWRQLGGDRAARRRVRVRAVAPDAVRPVPRRERPAAAPAVQAPVTLAECEELAARAGRARCLVGRGPLRRRDAARHLPPRRSLRAAAPRPGRPPRAGADPRRAPGEMFTADDALGWVYQFWQKEKKDEVNASERKIGGADLGPVTQLFTENYMVRFLLENSLGAWWAGRHPDSPLVKGFDYLRFDDDGTPAAGTFEGWPERVAEVTVMDPCCGSGHFLVEAFAMLWQMRAEEEGLTPVDAQDAVLRDNLFGLELDPRCMQIAVFALALQAWKAGGAGGSCPSRTSPAPASRSRRRSRNGRRSPSGDAAARERARAAAHPVPRCRHARQPDRPERATEISAKGLQRSLEDVDWEEVAAAAEAATHLRRTIPATAV